MKLVKPEESAACCFQQCFSFTPCASSADAQGILEFFITKSTIDYRAEIMIRKICFCFFCLLLFHSQGCFRSSGEIEFKGTVTVDGELVDLGIIEFESINLDTASGGGVIDKGAYTARVFPGEKIVRIRANKVLREYFTDDGTKIIDQQPLVPEAQSWNNSELRETITNKTKELNFDLKSK